MKGIGLLRNLNDFFYSEFQQIKEGNESVKDFRNKQKNHICYHLILEKKRCKGPTGLLVGFPVLSSDLPVMYKEYLNPKCNIGGCECEREVHVAFQLSQFFRADETTLLLSKARLTFNSPVKL